MKSSEPCFTLFSQSIDDYQLPERFTFPFYYEPHPLCLLAAQELQTYLSDQTLWQHNFGLNGNGDKGETGEDDEQAIGKMFGVLLVENSDGKIGYLSAFSGKVAEKSIVEPFVPPVFDLLAKGSFYHAEQLVINQLTTALDELIVNPNIELCKQALADTEQQAEQQIKAHQQLMVENRKRRKEQRTFAESKLDDLSQLQIKLSRESVADKNKLKDLKNHYLQEISNAQQKLAILTDEIDLLKDKRKQLSNALQQKIFQQYRFFNITNEEKNLADVFQNTIHPTPPAGSGECAAPKLLQHAFKWQMKPLAMAEFWWGRSPKSEIRQHKVFYPACQGKCQPILAHMLAGIKLDDNPLLNNPAEGKTIDIIYQDEDIVIINKPNEFLSVPGKNIEDSVYTRMKNLFPKATGSLIVHRLDMSTSGLMVIALNKRAHKSLQKQFINRTVQKRYIAIIDGILTEVEGTINLPLRGDFNDRPRQLVCFEHGKNAETRWQVLERKNNQTTLYLYPKTGRTHQLRVHCAHTNGLQLPIIGDDLYGTKAKRLYLHAQKLTLTHPVTKEALSFEVDAGF